MMFPYLLLLSVLHEHFSTVSSNCDTTNLYAIHHDYTYDWHLYYREIARGDTCRQHSFCPEWYRDPIFLCGYGFYNNLKNSTSYDDCLPCPAGSYCLAGVYDCEPGYYCPEGGLAKEPWPGYYAPNGRMTAPIECPVGTYQNHIQHISRLWRGISECLGCPEYMFCDVTRLTDPAGYCDDGWNCGENETSARPAGQNCQPGQYCTNGRQFPCEEGTYQPYENMHECFECPEGKYCAGTGLSAVSGECLAGWYCNRRSTTNNPTQCLVGHKCPNGLLTPCGKGYYQPNQGELSCLPCDVGKYCASTGLQNPTGDCDPGCCLEEAQISSSSCPPASPTSCTPGYYEVDGSCTACPEGMYCAISGLSAPSGPCEPGWYCETGEITPTPDGKLCPPGHKCPNGIRIACSSDEPYLGLTQYFYQPERGQTECVLCPYRYNCTEPALTDPPNVCAPGYRCHFGLIQKCEVGHYCYGGEMRPCRDGFTTNESGQDICVRCEDGFLCERGNKLPCPDNMVCINGMAEYCETGFECNLVNGAYVKTPCEPGTERFDVTTSSCTSCRQLRYCRRSTSYECMHLEGFGCNGGNYAPFNNPARPGNYYTLSIDTDKNEKGYVVKRCPKGTFQQLYAQDTCDPCKHRMYCGEEGLTSPSGLCSAGYYCKLYSTTPYSLECRIGHYCPEGSKDSTKCPVGTFQNETAQSSCKTCTAGYYCSTIKLSKPYICTVNSKCPEGSILPTACIEHTYQDEEGKSKCKCEAGYFCENIDENPIICDPGHFCINGTKSVCATGSYQPSTGQASCLLCDPGYYCTGQGLTNTSGICRAGHQCPEGSFEQLACESGFYQPDAGRHKCLLCPQGFYCNQTEAVDEEQSGAGSPTHGVVTPKQCPKLTICVPGSVFPICVSDDYLPGDFNITIRCTPDCRAEMSPFGELRFKATCENCGSKIESYEWSLRQCNSTVIQHCNHCVMNTTYMTEYGGPAMMYEHSTTVHNHAHWTYFGVVVKITLQDGTKGMAYFIYQYMILPMVDCQIAPITGIAMTTEFNVTCEEPVLPDYIDSYSCGMFYDYTSTDDTIIYQANHTCNQTNILLRQGDKTKGFRQHLRIVGKFSDSIIWDTKLLLMVDIPPISSESVGEFIGDVSLAFNNASNEKEIVESLNKMQGLTYMLNDVDVANTTNGTDSSTSGGGEGGDDAVEEHRKENMKIRDTVVNTISQVNTTSIVIITSVASTLNQVTKKKGELSEETKERTYEMYSNYTKRFQEMESTTLDEEVNSAAKTLLYGVAAVIDIVTDEIEIDDSQQDTEQTAKVTTPSPVLDEEKEKTKKIVKEKTEKLLQSIDNIAKVVMSRQVIDSKPTSVETPIMSISVGKISHNRLVGTSIDSGSDDKESSSSITFPPDLKLSDSVGSVGTEFMAMKKNPYVWASNSGDIKPPIVTVKLKDENNKALNFSNLPTPMKVNLATKVGSKVGEILILLNAEKANGTFRLVPTQTRPCAATFELTIEKETVVSLTLNLPENLTALSLSIGLDSKFNRYDRNLSYGFRFPHDKDIIQTLYGKLSETDEQVVDSSSYCEMCSTDCCNTTGLCPGIYAHCIYYCKHVIRHPAVTSDCLKKASPLEYCDKCTQQCCNQASICGGTMENCEIFCNLSMAAPLSTECLEYIEVFADNYTRIRNETAQYCETCQTTCFDDTEARSGIFANCIYFCESMYDDGDESPLCEKKDATDATETFTETMYLFPRSRLTGLDSDGSHQIYFGIGVDDTDKNITDYLASIEPRCLGNPLLDTCIVEFQITIPLKLASMHCKYWDELEQTWSTKGVQVSKDSKGKTLQCLTDHLTSFSKSVLVAPSFIDPVDIELFLTFFENPVVVTCVIVVWMLYFFIIHWARQKDRSDLEQVGVIYCADNVAIHTYTYLVCIVTGWWTQAGTTANVYIYLKGTIGNCPRKCLKTPVRKCFQTGYEDWFLLTTEHSLGDIKSVTLWHDNSGSSPHWYVNQVFVKDLQTEGSWVFVYNDWLAADRGSLLMTTTTLQYITEEELKYKRRYNFFVKSTQDLRNGHIWLSIFSKPASSTFTRVQRLTCCLTLLLTTMLTNIMFYGIPTDNPEDQVTTGDFSISLSQIGIGIQSSLIMFPVNILIVQLFLRVKKKPVRRAYSEPKPIEYFLDILFEPKWKESMVEMNKKIMELLRVTDDETEKLINKRQRPSEDVVLDSVSKELAKKDEGKIFPWWFVYIAWTIALFTCMTSSYFVMLYGLKYGYTRSVEWLVSFFTGFFQSVCVQQPVKVIGIAVVLTMILKKPTKVDDHAPYKRQDEDAKYLHSVCITPPETHQLVMEPLPRRLLDQIRDRLRMEWLMDVTIRDMILHALYLIAILVMVHGHRNIYEAFQSTNTVRAMFVTPADGFHIEEVSGRDDFYQYLRETVVPAITDIKSDHSTTSIGSNHYLVGTYRLRQLRMKQDGCKPIYYNLPHACQDPYWQGSEDTRSYKQSWSNPLKENESIPVVNHWVHQSAWQLKTLPYPGAHATYSGGGYVLELPENVEDHLSIFSSLESSEWIDGYTRAVFLEFTLFNPNVQLFTVVVYLFEFTTIGHVSPMYNEFTARLYHYSSGEDILVAVSEALFLCFNILFVVVEVKKLRKNGKHIYFGNFWTYIEIVQIALAITMFGLFIKRILSVQSVMEEFHNSSGQYFVNFYSAMFWDFVLGYVSATLVCLVIIKTIKHVRYNKRTRIISTTFSVIRTVFFGHGVIFVIASIAFAHLAYIMFGNSMEDYQSFGDSWVTIIIILMGEADYVGLQDSYRSIGPFFIVSVIMICQYGLMVMMTTILNIGRLEARHKLLRKKSKFDLTTYIGKKIKLILNIK